MLRFEAITYSGIQVLTNFTAVRYCPLSFTVANGYEKYMEIEFGDQITHEIKGNQCNSTIKSRFGKNYLNVTDDLLSPKKTLNSADGGLTSPSANCSH